MLHSVLCNDISVVQNGITCSIINTLSCKNICISHKKLGFHLDLYVGVTCGMSGVGTVDK